MFSKIVTLPETCSQNSHTISLTFVSSDGNNETKQSFHQLQTFSITPQPLKSQIKSQLALGSTTRTIVLLNHNRSILIVIVQPDGTTIERCMSFDAFKVVELIFMFIYIHCKYYSSYNYNTTINYNNVIIAPIV